MRPGRLPPSATTPARRARAGGPWRYRGAFEEAATEPTRNTSQTTERAGAFSRGAPLALAAGLGVAAAIAAAFLPLASAEPGRPGDEVRIVNLGLPGPQVATALLWLGTAAVLGVLGSALVGRPRRRELGAGLLVATGLVAFTRFLSPVIGALAGAVDGRPGLGAALGILGTSTMMVAGVLTPGDEGRGRSTLHPMTMGVVLVAATAAVVAGHVLPILRITLAVGQEFPVRLFDPAATLAGRLAGGAMMAGLGVIPLVVGIRGLALLPAGRRAAGGLMASGALTVATFLPTLVLLPALGQGTLAPGALAPGAGIFVGTAAGVLLLAVGAVVARTRFSPAGGETGGRAGTSDAPAPRSPAE